MTDFASGSILTAAQLNDAFSGKADQSEFSPVKSSVDLITSGSAPIPSILTGNEVIPGSLGTGLIGLSSLALAKLAVQAGPDGSFNFSPTKLPKWRAALGRVRAGTGNGKILCLGDSTTAGAWSNGSWMANALVKSYPKQLASMLSGSGVPANGEGVMGGHNWAAGNSGLTSYDPRLALGGNWAINTGTLTLGSESISITSGSGTLSFTPSIQVDTFEIYFISNSGLGSFTANFNGGSTISTVATGGASGVGRAIVSGALGANTLNIAPTGSGAIYIVGFVAFNSAVKQISVINAGWVGALASDVGSQSSPWASANAIPTVSPDLTIIDCSINDWNNSTPVNIYKSAMQQAINQAQLSGDVILMTGAPSNTSAASNGQMAAIVGANYGLALSNNVPLIDTVARWISWGVSNPLGFYGSGEIIHPSGPGYADISQSVAARLLSV